jgi:biotin transport system substrate-specific component
MALSAGIGAKKDNVLWLTFWLVVGVIINFTCGVLMFSFVTSNSLFVSFTYVVLPFIPTAIIKIIMVIALGKALKRALARSGVLL